ncbi:DUF4363 family protein [Clostridium oceanicum]|uniref:DUF4363 family protein n=1 Tax=Clostridium oceanicum TaxID=1543 RepID=A0ABP3UXN0_9CLOT
MNFIIKKNKLKVGVIIKKTIVSIILFIVTITIVTFYSFALNKECTELINQSNTLENLVLSNSWDKAYKQSNKLLKDWQNDDNKISMVINHSEIENIHVELWKFTQYIKMKNKDEALASIHVIKYSLKHIINNEKVNIRNIL